jgi:hypothetical protein
VKCMKNLKEDDIVISWGVNGEEEWNPEKFLRRRFGGKK